MIIKKRLLAAAFTLTMFTLFTKCSKESQLPDLSNKKTIELSFKNGTIKEKLYLEKGVWNTESKTLIKKEFRDSETGQNSYGYTIKNGDKNSSSDKKSKAHSIETGLYGWNGRCFVWGTLYTGDNGESIFVAASISTQLLLNVCPEDGSVYSKKKRK